MAARQQVLDKTDLFGTLPPELLGQLRDRTALARLRRGDVIFEKGDPATSLYVVFSGRVAIAAKAADGRESVISVLGPGRAVRRDVDVRRRRALRARPRAHHGAPHRGRVRRRARGARAPARRALGRRAHPRPPPARDRRGARRRDVPRRDRAAPPSGCSPSPTATTTSACRSRRRSWPAWSARPASG